MTTPMESAAEVIAWSLEDRGLSPSDWSGHFADKVQEALDAAGYAIVPKVATADMAIEGAATMVGPDGEFSGEECVVAQRTYAAMIKAATTPKED